VTHTASAVVFEGPRLLATRTLGLAARGASDVFVKTLYSGVSTGTERLFYTGEMPDFPGMGYPLVPGYETVAEVIEAPKASGLRPGDSVFVPGANCYDQAKGLFGGAASHLVTAAHRVIPIDSTLGEDGVLFALAATAHHAVRAQGGSLPDLVIGHGALGRLVARVACAYGARPQVWEINPDRHTSSEPYEVCSPDPAGSRRFNTIIDASGWAAGLDQWIGALAPRGELVLAGFYTRPLGFDFVPAFLREARIRIAAQWQPQDLEAVRQLVLDGDLSLAGIVSNRATMDQAHRAYQQAFEDPACLKMVIDWRTHQ